jgi:hypothetical protein
VAGDAVERIGSLPVGFEAIGGAGQPERPRLGGPSAGVRSEGGVARDVALGVEPPQDRRETDGLSGAEGDHRATGRRPSRDVGEQVLERHRGVRAEVGEEIGDGPDLAERRGRRQVDRSLRPVAERVHRETDRGAVQQERARQRQRGDADALDEVVVPIEDPPGIGHGLHVEGQQDLAFAPGVVSATHRPADPRRRLPVDPAHLVTGLVGPDPREERRLLEQSRGRPRRPDRRAPRERRPHREHPRDHPIGRGQRTFLALGRRREEVGDPELGGAETIGPAPRSDDLEAPGHPLEPADTPGPAQDVDAALG